MQGIPQHQENCPVNCISLVLQVIVCPFVRFLLAIVLSVLLRYTDSDYPFGIFKLFLHMKIHRNQIINISLFSQLMIGWWFVPSFRTISTGLFMGHSVGGWTGGEETRVLSFYAFISTNPSAISLAKADNFIGFTWSNAQCHL